MKKKIMIGLLAIGSIVMAESAQDVLKKAREDYYREQKEAARPAKPAREEKVREPKKLSRTQENSDGSQTVQEVTLDTEEEAVEEVKPRTPMEKLEYNAEKAKIKVDYYERVVRSVEREEKELNGYNEILGKNKKKVVKKAPNKTTKKVIKK